MKILYEELPDYLQKIERVLKGASWAFYSKT